MGIFHVFKIVQMAPNSVKHHIYAKLLTPFLANVPMYSLKTPEHLWFSGKDFLVLFLQEILNLLENINNLAHSVF